MKQMQDFRGGGGGGGLGGFRLKSPHFVVEEGPAKSSIILQER